MDARITKLTLISATGKSVGLLNIMSELNLFEDLFTNCMTGNIVINDSLNLINNLPLTGFEYLLISFNVENTAVIFNKTFRVYKLTNRIRTTNENETYILHFASEELILSESVLISRTYHLPIHAIVAEISSTILRIPTEKMKFIRETWGSHLITIPAYHPFKAINFVSRYALSQYKGASYVFYESRDGYYFESLEALSMQDSIHTITLSPKNIGWERGEKSDSQQLLEGAENLEFPESFDTLRNIYSGMYGGLLVAVDPLRQRITSNYYKGTTQFNQTKHVNQFPLISPSVNRFGKGQVEYAETLKRVLITTKDHDKIPYAQGRMLLSNSRIEEWNIPRSMYLTGIHGNRVTAAIPGNINLSIGSIVTLKLPTAEEQEKGIKKLDTLYSGRYLITSLRHKINQKNYACIAELSKDSCIQEFPIPKLSLTTIKGQ